MTVYLVYEASFPTDYDGELVGIYFFKSFAEKIQRELKKEHPDSDVNIREERLCFLYEIYNVNKQTNKTKSSNTFPK